MEAGRQEEPQWGARWFWTELVPLGRERRGHGRKVNEIRRQLTEEEAQLHRLLMLLTTCEPLAESWGMEAQDGKSKEGDSTNSLICNTATLFRRNRGDREDRTVSARTAGYKDIKKWRRKGKR